MSDATKAVFLSYAREDADIARRIAEALRAFGVEVWFDQNELRGGDAWDTKIRTQIKTCALFVPLISQGTEARSEGYFRREWKLAIDRTHDMAGSKAFIVPVVIDETREADATVPEEFMRYQWTRLAHGVPSPQFVEQVKRLLEAPRKAASATRPAFSVAASTPLPAAPRSSSFPRWLVAVAGVALLGAVAFFALRPTAKERAAAPKSSAETKAAAPRPAEKSAAASTKTVERSVAVLAFANLSDDKENEYFSDGISEELLTVLQKIPGLHVAARTSAFSFKGKNVTAQEIGEKLGVANLVEGSVRRAGSTVRISARLSRAATGEQLWSDNFTRDLKDVFAVQSEIALTIVEQLRGQLGGAAAKAAIQAQVQAAEKGGTKNAEAHQLYLQGNFFYARLTREDLAKAADFFRRAVGLDPSFTLALAALSRTLSQQAAWGQLDRPLAETFKESRALAQRALALEPDLAEAHLALLYVQTLYDLDWRGAAASSRRALELAPSNALMLSSAARLAALYGQSDRAIALARQALALDPLNTDARSALARVYGDAGNLPEAEAELRRLLEFNPTAVARNLALCGFILLQGRIDEAAEIAEREKEDWARLTGFALVRWAQKKIPEADEALRQLKERHADDSAVQIAQVYAYRRDFEPTFAWLERAYVQHDAGLAFTRSDPFLNNLHADPRWPIFLRKLGLADDQLK